MSDFKLGVDLSNYQDLTPQKARALKAAGVELVIVRASHENQTLIDIAMRQMQIVVDADMALHAYGWSYFTEDPAATAARWRTLYEDFPIGRFYPDCEDTKYVGTPAHNEAWLQEALRILGEQWELGVYTGKWWWVPYMGNSTAFRNLPLWDADYNNAPNLNPGVARLYGAWARRAIHQYTGNGSLAGISPLDLDAVDPALLGEEAAVTDVQMAEVQRIARDEVIRNIEKALTYELPPEAVEALWFGALPAAQTLARGLQPGEGAG